MIKRQLANKSNVNSLKSADKVSVELISTDVNTIEKKDNITKAQLVKSIEGTLDTKYDDRVLTSDEYHKLWIQMTIKFTANEPILAMCCSKAEEFEVKDEVLSIGFNYETSMLLLENESNKNIILDELFNGRKRLVTSFYLLDKPVDEVQINVNRIKSLFDKEILKISKK